jgi:hypothetical protein
MKGAQDSRTETIEKIENVRAMLSRRFVSGAYSNLSVIQCLSTEEARAIAKVHFRNAPGWDYVDKAMRSRGLHPDAGRALAYSVFSRKLSRPKFVCVIPYTSHDSKSDLVGGVGFAQDQGASGVVVKMQGTEISSFVTLELNHGKPIEREVTASQLSRGSLEELAREPAYEKTRDRDHVPEVDIEDSAAIAEHSFGVLVTDEHSSMAHSPAQISSLLGNSAIVRSIAQLQHMRLSGVHMDVNACCSTCSCCWGCCCSSATSSLSYVGQPLARSST